MQGAWSSGVGTLVGSLSPGFCLWLVLGLHIAPRQPGVLLLLLVKDWGWTLLGELQERMVPWVQGGPQGKGWLL